LKGSTIDTADTQTVVRVIELLRRRIANDRKGPAIANYTEVLRLDPQNKLFYFARGIVWERKHNLQATLADFTKFQELDPANPAGPQAIERVRKAMSSDK
jgi:tetratricopeptide (TPR) repeat protein